MTKSNMRYSLSSLLLFCALCVNILFIGCYSFSGASIPAHLKTIGIPLATDNSGFGRSEIRQLLTDQLQQKFTREGSLQVRDRAVSDAVLEVTITRVTDDPISVKAGDELTNKRVTVIVDAVYQDKKMQKVVWQRSFSQYADYPVDQSLEGFNKATLSALDKLTEDLMLGVISNW
jgi:hypothetical protein